MFVVSCLGSQFYNVAGNSSAAERPAGSGCSVTHGLIHNNLTVLHWNRGFYIGNHPQMALISLIQVSEIRINKIIYPDYCKEGPCR